MTLAKFLILMALTLTLMVPATEAATGNRGKAKSACAQALSGDIDLTWLQETARRQRDEITAEQSRLHDTLQNSGFSKVVLNLKIIRDHVDAFTKSLTQKVATNQKQSGRCWLFASLNVLRSRLLAQKKFDTDSEFSEAHMHFANMLEKSNKLLENVIKNSAMNMTREDMRRTLEVDSDAIGDGGEYQWFVFLVKKYGLIPKDRMPETASSQNTAALIEELRKHLGIITVELTQAAKGMKHASGKYSAKDLSTLRELKRKGMERVIKILTAHLGNFVYPDEEFEWRRTIKDEAGNVKKTIIETFTPKTFASDFVGFDPDEFVTVSSTVLQPYHQAYVVKDTSIGVEAPGEKKADLHYINLPLVRLKELVKNSIDMGIPVYFGSDVRRDVDRDSGIMNTEIFDTNSLYGFVPGDMPGDLTHVQEVKLGIAEAVHAMAFIGYDQPPGEKDDKGDNKVIKYEVENSWGGRVVGGITLPQNNLAMYENWFDKYVFEIVVPRKALNAEELALWKKKPRNVSDSAAYYGFSRH